MAGKAGGFWGWLRGRGKAARSLENPNVPLNWQDPDEDTYSAFGADRTSSGVRVTQRKALGYPAVWRAVNLISGDVAKLSLVVYKNKAAEGKEVDKLHPAYKLLKYKAGSGLLSFHLKQVLQLHALVRGNGYAYIDRTGGGVPVGLKILDPAKVTPGRVGGETLYVYKFDNGREFPYPAADILHIKGLGSDGLRGYSALDLLRDAFGAAIAGRDFGARVFKNDARPGGVIKAAGKLSPQARQNMRESWARLHQGVDNAHKIAIMEEGAEFVPIAATARDAQLLESREFDSREIANIFGVPAHKLGDPSKVAYNSLGEENQSYYNDTLSTWLTLWAAECSDKLLSEEEKRSESHCIDFDYREVQRANLASLTTYATAAVNGGWASVDEVRALFGDNPAPDGLGKWKAKPEPAPAPEPPPAPPETPERSTAGLRAVVTDTARRMAKRIVSDAGKYRGEADGFAEWIGSRYHYHTPAMRAAFDPVAHALRDAGLAGGPHAISDQLWRHCRAGLIEAGPSHLEGGADALIEHVSGRLAAEVIGAEK